MLGAALGVATPQATVATCRASDWRVASLVVATICDADPRDEAATRRLQCALISATNICADVGAAAEHMAAWRQLAQLIALVVSRHAKDRCFAMLPVAADVAVAAQHDPLTRGADADVSSLHELLDATNHDISSRVGPSSGAAQASRAAVGSDELGSASTDDTLEAIHRELDEQSRQRALTAVASLQARRAGAQRTAVVQLATCVRSLRDCVPWTATHWPVAAPDGFTPFVAPSVALLAAEGILPTSAAVAPRYMVLRRAFLDPAAQALLQGLGIDDPARMHPTLLRFVAPLRRVRADPQAWPAGPQHIARMWVAVLRVLNEHEPSAL